MGVLSNRVRKDELQVGDHIYSWRTAYSYAHHGIYMGDDKVVHFTRGRNEELGTGTYLDVILVSSRPKPVDRNCSECGLHENSNGVVMSCLDCFLADCPLYRFQYAEHTITFLAKARGGTCSLAEADPPELVLHRANYLYNNGFGLYHIFHNNCEDFAIYCKTGLLVMDHNLIGRSGQAASVLGAPFAAVISSPLRFMMTNPWGMVAVSAGVYFFCRYATDIGIRKDVCKVAVEDLAINMGWASEAAMVEASRSGVPVLPGTPALARPPSGGLAPELAAAATAAAAAMALPAAASSASGSATTSVVAEVVKSLSRGLRS